MCQLISIGNLWFHVTQVLQCSILVKDIGHSVFLEYLSFLCTNVLEILPTLYINQLLVLEKCEHVQKHFYKSDSSGPEELQTQLRIPRISYTRLVCIINLKTQVISLQVNYWVTYQSFCCQMLMILLTLMISTIE